MLEVDRRRRQTMGQFLNSLCQNVAFLLRQDDGLCNVFFRIAMHPKKNKKKKKITWFKTTIRTTLMLIIPAQNPIKIHPRSGEINLAILRRIARPSPSGRIRVNTKLKSKFVKQLNNLAERKPNLKISLTISIFYIVKRIEELWTFVCT